MLILPRTLGRCPIAVAARYAPGQHGITVLGQAYGQLRYKDFAGPRCFRITRSGQQRGFESQGARARRSVTGCGWPLSHSQATAFPLSRQEDVPGCSLTRLLLAATRENAVWTRAVAEW
jgi:hypothetical protein